MKTRRSPCTRLSVEELEPRVVPSTVYSTNWSGYAAETSLSSPQAGAVSAVSGGWTVPAVTGSGTAYSSFWVGIDGFSSRTVEQIGTDSDLSNGVPTYYAWYEMYPNPFVKLSMTVNPGDTISASVTYTGSNQFSLQITDTQSGQSYSTTQVSTSAQRSSAEWIAEAPSGSFGHILPLANFGTAYFTGASATINGTTGPVDNASWKDTSITMATKTGVLKAAPSGLTDTTTPPITSSFSVTALSSGSGGGKHGPNVAKLATTDATGNASASTTIAQPQVAAPDSSVAAVLIFFTTSPTAPVIPTTPVNTQLISRPDSSARAAPVDAVPSAFPSLQITQPSLSGIPGEGLDDADLPIDADMFANPDEAAQNADAGESESE
jgi:hypothetical protein